VLRSISRRITDAGCCFCAYSFEYYLSDDKFFFPNDRKERATQRKEEERNTKLKQSQEPEQNEEPVPEKRDKEKEKVIDEKTDYQDHPQRNKTKEAEESAALRTTREDTRHIEVNIPLGSDTKSFKDNAIFNKPGFVYSNYPFLLDPASKVIHANVTSRLSFCSFAIILRHRSFTLTLRCK
jgi:hypothetical protein